MFVDINGINKLEGRSQIKVAQIESKDAYRKFSVIRERRREDDVLYRITIEKGPAAIGPMPTDLVEGLLLAARAVITSDLKEGWIIE